MVFIFTHRGLEPSKPTYDESTYEAFSDQISRGFGLEFDPNFTQDGIIIYHDKNLLRVFGKDRPVSNANMEELSNLRSQKGNRVCSIDDLFELISQSSVRLHALHLKNSFQDKIYLEKLTDKILEYDLVEKLLLFDVKPDAALYLKQKIPHISLAPSVSHSYDIERYAECVGDTLLSIEQALSYSDRYNWVWLDEWDTLDVGSKTKRLYTESTFKIFKDAGFKIGLVTPELHATSPGLYGGEAHGDAKNQDILFERIRLILKLQPDAICTDYPEEVLDMMNLKNT